MNNKFISLATAAALLTLGFSACNKDDASKPNVITPDKTTAYAKVSISMGVTTRADEVFDAGTADEAKVGKISLALYDQYGTYVGSGELTNDDPVQGKIENVSDTYANKIFKLNLFEGANEPTQVIAFINTDPNDSRLEVLTETGVELAAKRLFVGDYPTGGTSFAMTNSGYFDGNNYVVAAKLGNIFKTKELAEKGGEDESVDEEDVTTIYVERLAAKVKVDVATELDNEPDYEIKDVAGEDVTLKFTPTKWAATGTAKNEWLVKTKYTSHTDWKGDFRTFWAESFAYTYGYNDYYTTDGKVAGTNPLNYVNLLDMDPEMAGQTHVAFGSEDGVMYVPEHTTELQPNADPKNIIANTYALIVGNYEVQSNNHVDWFKDEKGNFDFYLLLSDMTEEGKKVYTIYNKSQLIGLLLHYNGLDKVYASANGEGSIITYPGAEGYTGELELDKCLDIVYNKTAGKYELAELAEPTGSLYYAVAGNEGTMTYVEIMSEDDDKEYENSTNSRHYYYQDGYAFFNAPIPHNYTSTENNVEVLSAVYGVVRNHSYIMTINKIESLGAPLNNDQYGPEGDPENPVYPPIIPDPDDLTDHFINASIKVLSWHEKSSGIVL